MTETLKSDSAKGTSFEFQDELLLALEKSGKTLVEIQSIILPWGNEKCNKMIIVGGKQYANDELSYPNKIHKRIRVRELLNATSTAQEQALVIYQDMTKRLKKAAEEKKSAHMRYKYLAGIAKKEFDVTVSKKRKAMDEIPTPGYPGAIRNSSFKRARFDDCDGDDEEEFSAKEEDTSRNIKLEKRGHSKLKEPLIPLKLESDNWRTQIVRYRPQSKIACSSSLSYASVKTEPSEESSITTMSRFDRKSPLQRLMDSQAPHLLRHTSQKAGDNSWVLPCTSTTTSNVMQTGCHSPPDNPWSSSSSEPFTPKSSKFYSCTPEISNKDTSANSAHLNAYHTDVGPETPSASSSSGKVSPEHGARSAESSSNSSRDEKATDSSTDDHNRGLDDATGTISDSEAAEYDGTSQRPRVPDRSLTSPTNSDASDLISLIRDVSNVHSGSPDANQNITWDSPRDSTSVEDGTENVETSSMSDVWRRRKIESASEYEHEFPSDDYIDSASSGSEGSASSAARSSRGDGSQMEGSITELCTDDEDNDDRSE